MKNNEKVLGKNPLWYKDAIIYQLHVRSFHDSNGDGIGDFRGLIRKLDYIQSLGVNTIWLLPFYPSPLKDGGYDIADFTGIHPSYGTLADFRRFVKEAHNRGLRIITELVLNHTSTAHKWFQRARKAKPGSVYRDFYVWSNDPEKYKDARIIFQDFEVSNWTFDHVAGAYYWHRFYSHQPDLNFENPRVQKEIFKVLDFWFDIGVDGFRLDAVPYLYEAEGTNCENLPETHEYLKKLRKYVDEKYEDRLLLAEANQWPNDACDYFGNGDECHMAFHFPLMPRLYMALRMEDRFPVVDILEQTPDIPDNCQWAIFLRNHDELTLEMVSDEERDYMYRSFAKDPQKRVNVGIRRRLFPLFGGDQRTIELLNFLLFSLPGTPIVYYGDEIGMGDNYYLGDRDGVRTPMQWSPDKNAGFSEADPQRLFLPVIIDHDYHYTTVNVENQERNPSSFLWWKRRVIAKRSKYKAFGRGSIKFINTNNPKILAFVREYQDETILVMVNLSRYSQYVELDLSEYAGAIPMEMFSRNDFPVISEDPYPFSMQFKNYFWFELRKAGKEETPEFLEKQKPVVTSIEEWSKMDAGLKDAIKQKLFGFVLQNEWFQGNPRKLRNVNIIDVIPVSRKKKSPYLFLVQLDLIESTKDIYLIPVSLAFNNKAEDLKSKMSNVVISPVEIDGDEGVIYDGAYDKTVQDQLFSLVQKRAKMKGFSGEIEGKSGSLLRKLYQENGVPKPHVIESHKTNTSIVYSDKFFLKIYRSPQEGENPDVEIIKNLIRNTGFRNVPPYMGRLDYHNPELDSTSLALLTASIPNVGSAWEMTETAIESFFDKVLSAKEEAVRTDYSIDENLEEAVGPFFLEMVELMGRRTAQLHMALASIKENKAFEPESFSLLYQKSLYQSFRTFVKRSFSMAKNQVQEIPQNQRALLDEILFSEEMFLNYIQKTLETEKIPTLKIRVHGNYKLDKVLFTGKDFMIYNFEGELEQTLSVRKLKYTCLKDVASMLSSFHYAVHVGYFFRKEFIPVDDNYLRPLLEKWYSKVADTFIKSYVDSVDMEGLIPEKKEHFDSLLNLYIFEKAVKEIRYFLEFEPSSLLIPLKALDKIRKRIP